MDKLNFLHGAPSSSQVEFWLSWLMAGVLNAVTVFTLVSAALLAIRWLG